MPSALRIVLLSYSRDDFRLLHEVCAAAGHTVPAYVAARSRRPNGEANAENRALVNDILTAVPVDVDLLLPAKASAIAAAVRGYAPDLLVCYSFAWRLPPRVLSIPRLGAINIHPSLLPKYRGPIPLHWAIRSGETEVGLTTHWMDEHFDTGPIIAQQGGVPVPEEAMADELFTSVRGLIPNVLAETLTLVDAGHPGEAQDNSRASYASWMEPEFATVDWSRPALVIHNKIRTFRFATSRRRGPVAILDDQPVEIIRTSLQPGEGRRVACADRPIWILETKPPSAQSPQDGLLWISAGT